MRFFALFVALMTATLTCDAAQESRIVAVINENVVTQKDLDNRLKLAIVSAGLTDSAQNRKDLKDQILNVMIDELLQLQAIKKATITVSDSDIEEAISSMEESSGSPQGYIAKLLKANHIPENVIKQQAETQLGWVDYLRGKYLPVVQVSDSMVDHELAKLQGAEQKAQYHLAEIILPINEQISKEKARKDISKLRADIQRGAHFSAVAQQFSQVATAAKGGDMGWLTEDDISPDMKAAIKQLQPGQLSLPIKLSNGYALIYLMGRQLPGEPIDTTISLLQVQMPYPFLPADYEVREANDKLIKLARSCQNCAEFQKKLTAIPGSKYENSGDMSIDQLNSEIRPLVAHLKPGQLSEVLPTQDGAIAFMVCNKKEIKPEAWTKDAVRNMLIQRKLSLLSRRDLRDLKRHAFIQVRE